MVYSTKGWYLGCQLLPKKNDECTAFLQTAEYCSARLLFKGRGLKHYASSVYGLLQRHFAHHQLKTLIFPVLHLSLHLPCLKRGQPKRNMKGQMNDCVSQTKALILKRQRGALVDLVRS